MGFVALLTTCALVGPPAGDAHAATYGASAVAQLTPKQALARATYKKAKMRFKAGDFAGALTLFRQADQLHPGGAPKYKIAECLDKLGRAQEAADAYQAFIDVKPGKKYEDRIVTARARIAALKASLGAKLTLAVTPAGLAYTVMVDGVPAQGPELNLQPGQHTIEVSAPGHQSARQQVTAQKGQQLTLNFALAPTVVVVPQPPGGDDGGDAGMPLMITGLIVGGLGLAAVVPTAIFGTQALDAVDRFDGGEKTDEVADEVEDNALLSDVFLGVSVGLVATGTVLFILGLGADGDDGGDSAAVPKITPLVGANGGGATVTWSF